MTSGVSKPAAVASRPIRLGVVSFLNTLPLIDGLERLADVQLRHSVPSRLVDQLVGGEVDLALCSSIDYQRAAEPLVIVPAGLLGCDGPTLTVRLYSRNPISELDQVFCDIDSHTSVALLRILLKELHGISPELLDYDAREQNHATRESDWPGAMLLIGDKVVNDSPPAERFPHQLDLGEAWRELTGMPFVFATWMALASADPAMLSTAAAVLDRQRRHNVERIDRIIARHAEAHGWPADLAREYLTQKLVYDVDDRRLAALELFFVKVREHGLIDRLRPVELAGE